MEQLSILWVSNAPHTPTGYGDQTREFAPRIRDLGHKMAISAFYGVQGAPVNVDGIMVLPAGPMENYNNDVLAADAEFVHADIVISLMDVWVLSAAITSQVRWCPWLPVDHDPAPPAVVDALQTAFQPIAYSQFGVAKLKAAGLEPLYVPHGVNTHILKPMDRAECRRQLAFPEDRFIVGIVAANKGAPSRKAFDEQIRAFALFHQRHPDSVLYLHTDMLGLQGENIRRIISLAGIPPADVIEAPVYRYSRGLLGKEWMAKMYNCFDVLMNASKGEGFGIPIVEAQACGTPVIVTDFSSMSELVFAGWAVEPGDKFFSQDSYQVSPSVPALVEALEQAYARRGDMDFRQQAVTGAQAYDADRVTQLFWKPALEQIAATLTPKTAAIERISVLGRQMIQDPDAYQGFYDAVAERDAAAERNDADAWYNEHRMALAVKMLRAIPVSGQHRVIDLGCAEGQLLSRVTGLRTGIDISPARIERAQKHHDGTIYFTHGDACSFGDEAGYDVVIAMELIEHVPDPEALLANIARILKPGGYTLITTPNDAAGVTVDGVEHLRGFDFQTLAGLISKHGLTPVAQASTVPGLYGAEGLLAHPDRLAVFQESARTPWDHQIGSNIYIIAHKPAAPVTDSRKRRLEKVEKANGQPVGAAT